MKSPRARAAVVGKCTAAAAAAVAVLGYDLEFNL